MQLLYASDSFPYKISLNICFAFFAMGENTEASYTLIEDLSAEWPYLYHTHASYIQYNEDILH